MRKRKERDAKAESFRFFFVGLFATDEFRFRAFDGFFGGFRNFFLFGAFDDDRVGRGESFHAFRKDEIGDANLLVETKVVNADGDAFRSVRRVGFDFETVENLFDDAAFFDARRFAAEFERKLDLDAFG